VADELEQLLGDLCEGRFDQGPLPACWVRGK
jgi:hypothetical protein